MRRLLGGIALLAGCSGNVTDETDGQTTDTSVVECPDAESFVDPVDGIVTALDASGTRVAWVERTSPTTPTVLYAMNADGSGQREVHRSIEGREIVSMKIAGDNIVFLETLGVGQESALFLDEVLPPPGVSATRVATRTWNNGEQLVGATAEDAYVIFNNSGATVDRIQLSDGFPTRVGQVAGTARPTHLVLDGEDIYFRAAPDAGGNGRVYHLSTSDENATAEALGAIGASPECGFPAGGLVATPDALVCGLDTVASFPRATGNGSTTVVEATQGVRQIPVASDGDLVYFIDRGAAQTDVPISVVSEDGSGLTDLACDVREVQYRTYDGNVPDQSMFQVALTDDAVFWVQERRGTEAGASTIAIKYAPR